MAKSYLPVTAAFGELETMKNLAFYDRPLLFTCKNASGQMYLARLEDDAGDVETWVIRALSPEDLALLDVDIDHATILLDIDADADLSYLKVDAHTGKERW